MVDCSYRMLLLSVMVVVGIVATVSAKGCTDGQLLPDLENCRKYFKCSNGEPSSQSCPGSLIFDPLLKICNWPESTTCISDLLPKKEATKPRVKIADSDLVLQTPRPGVDSDNVPTVPTAPPRTRTRTRTRVRPNLFSTKNRPRPNFVTSRRNRPSSAGGRDEVEDDSRHGDDFPVVDDVAEDSPAPRPRSKPIRCHTRASDELYPNPRNCRKYFKCENGGPSLQSCPANLIFDRDLKICNWPQSSSCIEDPEAELPEITSSDRHPPKKKTPTSNSVFVDIADIEADYGDTPSFAPPVQEHASVPTVAEATAKEKRLTDNPVFRSVMETVRVLDNDEVEKIVPGNPENPDNVQRVEFILTEESYEDLFPRRHSSYTYKRMLQAIGKFPAICAYRSSEDESDAICRKTLATMFAHFTQETGNHNPSDKEYDEWRQGLSVVRETGCTETGPGCGYNSNCEDKDSITKKWACGKDRTGKFRKYFGRGAKQLSYNFNYGQFSQAMFGDGRLLLDFPKFVADTWLNLASATWFYSYPQPPKPSMLHVIDGTWVPNTGDRRNGIEPGFGATINIINGGLECNTKDGRESKQAANRIAYYKKFAWYLYVDYENEQLGCAKQNQFTASGAGALAIYWDKDWQSPYSCKLVSYQTAFSSLVPGEYIDCVEENFKVKIR